MFYLLIVLGLLAFSSACRSYANRWVAKLGWFALLAATYIAGYGIFSESHLAGALVLSLWFLLPWVDILSHARRLRFPMRSALAHRFPPTREQFPELADITQEIEEAGFEERENTGWQWEQSDQFLRLFYHAESHTQAAVSLSQDGDFSISHVSVTSRGQDGRSWTTSNYPFPFTMKFSPEHQVHRCDQAENFKDLLAEHRRFLASQGIKEASLASFDPEQLSHYLEEELEDQIQHNVREGVLEPAGEEGTFRYSWRGCWFLWIEVVKDMIRV